MTEKQIKKLITGGFSNTEIKAMIDNEERLISEAKASALAHKAAEEKAKLLQEQIEEEDEPADTGISFAALQETFIKSWAVDAKINDKVDANVEAIKKAGTVINLTHLNTQKEIFDVIKAGDVILLKWGNVPSIVNVFAKTAANASLKGMILESSGNIRSGVTTIIATETTPWYTHLALTNLVTGIPTSDYYAANKKYVDDTDATTLASAKAYTDSHTPTLPKTITLVYDNGTTEDIKVGQ